MIPYLKFLLSQFSKSVFCVDLVVESLGLGLICTVVCAHALRQTLDVLIFSNAIHKHRYLDCLVYSVHSIFV